jgi:hypothetical protein
MNQLFIRAGAFAFCLLMAYAMACIFQHLYAEQHEGEHQAIFKQRGIESTVELTVHFTGLTSGYTQPLPDKNAVWTQEMQLAQDLNEVVGYNTGPWFFGITWGIWAIMFLLFFSFLEGKK